MRFIVSTVGTSILTNSINRTNSTEGTWFGILRDSANLKQNKLTLEAKQVINTLADRALEKLLENDVGINRQLSAELNGIYGIYNGNLPENSDDQHYLICTDTAQGQTTGNLIADFLRGQGFTVSVVTPIGLSTQDTKAFTTGTKELIKWLDDNVPRPVSNYKVIFNLVGGFKSLQGYMNTFGAFYADEVIYIFEAPTADLIKIPRLPIQIDTTVIENHLTKFALMAAGKLYPIEELEGIPETLLEPIEDGEEIVAGLSAWGELIWNRTKADLLGEELLQFPRLEYTSSFRNDFNNQRSPQARLKLQEKLAKIAVVLENTGGDITQLNRKISGLHFENFMAHDRDIYRFRITPHEFRASCKFENGGLTLIHYGQHEYVDNVSHAPYCTHC